MPIAAGTPKLRRSTWARRAPHPIFSENRLAGTGIAVYVLGALWLNAHDTFFNVNVLKPQMPNLPGPSRGVDGNHKRAIGADQSPRQ